MLIRTLLLSLLLVCSGCVYANVRYPLDTDLDKTKLGSKIGRSSMHGVLWMFSWGDGGTKAAAEDGNITTINHLDREVYAVFFGAYVKRTTIAYGD